MSVQDIESTRLLREALTASGHRFTSQRAEVFRALSDSDSHPTADEIFTYVRIAIPDISLATVYKALETLVSCGLARKILCGEGPARYDHRTDFHHHARCMSCGAVIDVERGAAEVPIGSVAATEGFEVIDYRLELIGYCRSCRN